MSRWRKKPIVIEAVQEPINKDYTREFPSWLMAAVLAGTVYETDDGVFIKTLEGNMKVSPGDWIIMGVQGELYPCKPDIFEATYEPA